MEDPRFSADLQTAVFTQCQLTAVRKHVDAESGVQYRFTAMSVAPVRVEVALCAQRSARLTWVGQEE